MSRFLLLALVFLSGCSDARSLDGVESWLDRWGHARSCLVEPAEDVATGVALARLAGRTCTVTIGDDPTADSGLHDLWRAANHELRTLDPRALPSVQALKIERIDRASLILGVASWRFATQMTAPRLTMIPEVPPKGIVHEVGQPPWPYPTPEEYGASAFVQRGKERTVLAYDGFHGLEGLLVHSSRNGGVTWRTDRMPMGVLRGGLIDPIGGRIWRYYRRNHEDTLERVDLDGTINVFPAKRSWRPAQRCRSKRPWRLLDGELMVEGELDYIKLQVADDLVACDERGALVLSETSVIRCDRDCYRVFTRPAQVPGGATLLPDGRWMFVATLEGVAACWVEGSARPSFYRLPDSRDEIVSLEMMGDQPMLLLGWKENTVIAFPKPPAARPVTTSSTQP
jgi:hypothetical protein